MKITDLTPYRKHVDQLDLTEEQKLQWVNAMLEVVERIFDLHLNPDEPNPFRKVSHGKPESNTENGS